jgi:toxin CcdB
MSRFDLYPAPGGNGYLLDVQSDFLESYSTRVAVPVVSKKKFPSPALTLNPIIEVDGVQYVVQIHFLSAVPSSILRKPVANYAVQADEITRALDLLFQGY